jgi:hypothetical protein
MSAVVAAPALEKQPVNRMQYRFTMCFSASASFAVAAGTGCAGVLGVRRASRWHEMPLASIPLLFATQQSLEGAVWLALGTDPSPSWILWLANGFVFVALVIWPVWAPLSAGLVERDRRRKLAMAALFTLAIPVAYTGLRLIWLHPYQVCVVENSLSYSNGFSYSLVQMAGYVLCTCGPFLLSSSKALRSFGALCVAGFVVSTSLYVLAFVSVWCFFAAAASLTVLLSFAEMPKRASWRTPA